jgi:hypothetical protein
MSMLTLVPKAELSPKQAVIERIKKRPRPDGMWQCNRCGSRHVMSSECGVYTKNGRKQRGTVIHEHICADCFKRGIEVSMRPKLTVKK